MKKLNITKERFEKSRYFQNKYGTLEYVSESGKLFKTDKGKILQFKESLDEIRARSRTARERINNDITKSEDFKKEIERLEDKIGSAADKGNNYVEQAIVTYMRPYEDNPKFFQAICKYFEDQGFSITQTRCSDGFPYAEHYDIWWDD